MRLGILWAFALPIALAACSGSKIPKLGVIEGRLAPCPKSPNCVSTQSDDEKHGIAPIRYAGSREEAKTSLLGIIRSMPGTRIVRSTELYIHAEFSSRIFRFVDDVEFYLDDDKKVIHFRSASRIGYSDMGANRKRMEAIRESFKNPANGGLK